MVVALFVLSVVSVRAQDTVYFRNGEELVVKVTEVSDTHVKYHLWNNQSGPVYSKSVSDIFMVKYKGGHKEVFSGQQPAVSGQPARVTGGDVFNQLHGKGEMDVSRGDLLIDNVKLNDDMLEKLLTADELATYQSASRQRRVGKGLMIPGIVVSGVGFLLWFPGMITMAASSYYSDYVLGASLFASGMSVFGIGQGLMAAGIPLKAIGSRRMKWVADSYNQRTAGTGVSMSLSPMMFSNPDRTSGGIAYGAGLTLNF